MLLQDDLLRHVTILLHSVISCFGMMLQRLCRYTLHLGNLIQFEDIRFTFSAYSIVHCITCWQRSAVHRFPLAVLQCVCSHAGFVFAHVA